MLVPRTAHQPHTKQTNFQFSKRVNFLQTLINENSQQHIFDDKTLSFLKATAVGDKRADPFDSQRSNARRYYKYCSFSDRHFRHTGLLGFSLTLSVSLSFILTHTISFLLFLALTLSKSHSLTLSILLPLYQSLTQPSILMYGHFLWNLSLCFRAVRFVIGYISDNSGYSRIYCKF